MSKKKIASKKRNKKPISPAVRARLIPIRGDKKRRFKDSKTGRTYSRRQYEKQRPDRKPRKNINTVSIKQQKYITMRDIFIHSQKTKGIKWTKREAMQSEELKKIIRGLHSKNIKVRQKAFDDITAGDKTEWVPYDIRHKKGEL